MQSDQHSALRPQLLLPLRAGRGGHGHTRERFASGRLRAAAPVVPVAPRVEPVALQPLERRDGLLRPLLRSAHDRIERVLREYEDQLLGLFAPARNGRRLG